MLPLLSFVFGLSLLGGLNLYLVVLLTGIAVRQEWGETVLHPALAVFGHPAVIAVAAVLFVVEFIVDKIPWADSLWDAVHTLIRPAGAALAAWIVLGQAGMSGGAVVICMLVAGLIALSTHLTKAGIRLVVNASPEPVTNSIASLVEDALVTGLLILSLMAPVSGLALGLLLLAGVWMALPRMFRQVRTALGLMWKKMFHRTRTAPRQGGLPVVPLTWEQEELVRATASSAGTGLSSEEAAARDAGHRVTAAAAAAAWAVPCVTGKIRLLPGLRPNRRGVLVSPAGHPGVLVFLMRRRLAWRASRIPLAGVDVRREETFLSHNVVIRRPEDGLEAVFRFSRAEAALADRLMRELETTLGLREPLPAAMPGLPRFLPGTFSRRPSETVWAARPEASERPMPS